MKQLLLIVLVNETVITIGLVNEIIITKGVINKTIITNSFSQSNSYYYWLSQ